MQGGGFHTESMFYYYELVRDPQYFNLISKNHLPYPGRQKNSQSYKF